MQFEVIATKGEASAWRDVVHLRHTGWDDWFQFSTLYDVTYYDGTGYPHNIGLTKIGRFGLIAASRDATPRDGYRTPKPPQTFTLLPDQYFSLGQDSSFYEALTKIGDRFRDEFLEALRDIAYDRTLRSSAMEEDVTRVSLLRDVPQVTLNEQFSRLAHGGARLTPFDFNFKSSGLVLNFHVDPDSRPPTNIQVLIGRNGVGKSTLLNKIARALVRNSGLSEGPKTGQENDISWRTLSNLISVSFSAFDQFEPIGVPRDRTKTISYHYVGLKRIGAKADEIPLIKDPKAQSAEMTKSARSCLIGARRSRWLRALRILEVDPVFADTGIGDLVSSRDEDEVIIERLGETFRGLSSGHKIVLLTITRLVETTEEKSLILLDEPEAHLHPPLLSAFIRALSDLLTNRNGMAIIATHSPVVLQEVPRKCVWKLYRTGNNLSAERPEIETFGENVGTLTDDVFGLEVIGTGFHEMLREAAMQTPDYDDVISLFDGQIGAEGRALLRAIIHSLGRAHVER